MEVIFKKEGDEDFVIAFINTKEMQLKIVQQSVKNKAKASSLMTRNHICMRPLYVDV